MAMNPKQQLMEAAQRGDALYFEPWERNPGVIEMRRINAETRPNTGGRMQRAQMAFPHIKALWEQISGGIQGLAIPKTMKQTMSYMFQRMRTDKEYAMLAYNIFPVLADRYGAGRQANGKPRLSFVRMIDDPLARRLLS